MSNRNPGSPGPGADDTGEAPDWLQDLYHEGAADQPSAELDRTVQEAARAAAKKHEARRGRPWLRWAPPMATAAVLVISAAVVLRAGLDVEPAVRPAAVITPATSGSARDAGSTATVQTEAAEEPPARAAKSAAPEALSLKRKLHANESPGLMQDRVRHQSGLSALRDAREDTMLVEEADMQPAEPAPAPPVPEQELKIESRNALMGLSAAYGAPAYRVQGDCAASETDCALSAVHPACDQTHTLPSDASAIHVLPSGVQFQAESGTQRVSCENGKWSTSKPE